MNYFKLFIGDYQRDTGILSLAEHGAYMLMLQYHYATETPLPTGRELFRLLRAESRTDRAAIMRVCELFWDETPDGLINRRATSEIALSQEKTAKNREIGKLGGRPKKTETDIKTETQTVSKNNPIHSHSHSHKEEKKDSRAMRSESGPGFEDFYRAFPLHKARGAAEKAWAKATLIAKPETIITGARRYAAEMRGKEPRYIAHPATWLNQQRWLDGQVSQHPASLFESASADIASRMGEGYIPPAFGGDEVPP